MNLKKHLKFIIMQHLDNNNYYSTSTEGVNVDLDRRKCTFTEDVDRQRTSELSIYTNDSNDVVKKLIKEHEKLIYEIDSDDRLQGSDDRQKDFIIEKKVSNNLTCEICKDHTFNTNGCKKNYIILSCNHIFHIYCLAQSHYKKFSDTLNIFDKSDSFDNCACTICNEKLELEQILYLHSTFMSNTKNLLTNHQNSIEHLEGQLQQLKIELRTLYNYKYKLEKEREKSKQIMCILNTML
jgi:hypothetical protein